MNRFLKKSEEHLKANEKARKYQAKIQKKVGVYRNSFKAQNHFYPKGFANKEHLCFNFSSLIGKFGHKTTQGRQSNRRSFPC